MNSSVEDVLERMRPLTSAVEPRGGRPGVVGGKLWVRVLVGTRGEKFEVAGREYKAEERNMFRGVEVTPEKLVAFGMFSAACDAADVGNEGGGLLGLSPGIRLGVVSAMLDGRCAISDAEMLWESLLDGPWGRLIILRLASCDSEARFIGLCGASAP